MSAGTVETALGRMREAGSRVWLDTGTCVIRFRELDERIGRVAGLVARRGIGLGERVVIASGDDGEVALLAAALVASGITMVNLDPDAAAERVRPLIEKSAPVLLVMDQEIAARWDYAHDPRLLPIAAAAPKGLLGGFMRPAKTGLHRALDEAPITPPRDVPPETLAYILFTSGTTKEPKGVCISHRALFSHLDTLARVYGCDGKSVLLNTLMLSHADGIVQGPIFAWHLGATLHRPVTFSVGTIERLLDAVYQLRITHMIAVPTMLALMTKLGDARPDAFAGGDFRMLVSCGAALEPALWQATEKKFGVGIVNVYGLTETVAGGVFAGSPIGIDAIGSIGEPIDCALRIVDETGAAIDAADAPGELMMHGDLLMSGYFDDPAQTAEVLRDGWLSTGDMAYRDDEGRYFICGRKKNIVIRGGLNINPEEVTEAIGRHPAVAEAVAFGLPDPVWGERLVALAVAPDLDEPVLMQHLGQLLEPRKLPSQIMFVGTLPRGRSGKVVIEEARALFDRAAAGPVAATAAGGDDDDAARLIAVAAACLKVDPGQLSLDTMPEDVLGWDSLAHMELVVAIEREFGVFFPPRDVIGLDRLGKALELIRRR